MKAYNDILVSVVMPVYNGSLYLREAIDSILSQTHTNLEFIIVNDGSTDNSEDIILSYDDPRICYYRNETNCGICVTLNKGLDVARGKYIARMDCDDVSIPERLQKQVEYMEEHPSIGIVGSDIVVFGKYIDEHIFTFEHDKYCCKAGLLFNTCFAHPSVMMRKRILEDNNLRYDESSRGFEDFELWYRMSKSTEMVNIHEPLLYYRKHNSQVTQNESPELMKKLYDFLSVRVSEFASIDTDKLSLLNAYCHLEWKVFDNDNLMVLSSVFSEIIKSKHVTGDEHFKRAMQITLSKALVYTILNAPNVKLSKLRIYTKALFNGIMPFDWYLKFIYHSII